MNPDDVYGYPSIEIVYQLKTLVGRRVRVTPFFVTYHPGSFSLFFSGSSGTIVAHTPIIPGLTEKVGVWYFTPDEGIGMVVPIDPNDVVFIDEEY